jgi:hypothetical protein
VDAIITDRPGVLLDRPRRHGAAMTLAEPGSWPEPTTP